MPVCLRPHHGMCIQFYEGKGYDADFTDHMGKIVQTLYADPSQPVRVTLSADAVCRRCPNNKDGICADQAKVRRYDEAALRLCGFRDGDVMPFSGFLAAVREKIIDPGLRRTVCGDCCWDPICARKS